MTSLALLFVLLAGACHAAWNIAAKKARSDQHFIFMGALMVSALWAPAAAWSGVDRVAHWGAAEWGVLTLSAMIHVAYFRVLLHGYAVSDLSVVYPVARGSAPLAASLGAVFLLGENLSLWSAIGALAVGLGVWVIAGGPKAWRNTQDPAAQGLARRGITWGALTGLLAAGYTMADAYAVKRLSMSPILVIYFSALLRVLLLLPIVLKERQALLNAARVGWRAALTFAILAPLGYGLVLLAVGIAPLSRVAPAREVSMLFAAIFAGRLLGEGNFLLRLTGAASIVVGVVALSLS